MVWWVHYDFDKWVHYGTRSDGQRKNNQTLAQLHSDKGKRIQHSYFMQSFWLKIAMPHDKAAHTRKLYTIWVGLRVHTQQ